MSGVTYSAPKATKAYVWGYNNTGELGIGHSARVNTPFPARLPPGLVDLQGGANFSVAITKSGEVWTWGSNNHGQLGDGTRRSRREPKRVKLPRSARASAIAAGTDHVLVLTTDRKVLAWGRNHRGQLGTGSTDDLLSPHLIAMEPVKKVAAGDGISAAISSTDRLICWGRNHARQLGMTAGAPKAVLKPTKSTVIGTRIVAVDAGLRHLIVLTWDGQVLALGQDPTGRSLTHRVPFKAAWGQVRSISAGEDHSLALTNRGVIVAWGANDVGQLGVGKSKLSRTPVEVPLPGAEGHAVEVRAGHRHSLVRTDRHTVFAWGDGRFGAVGIGRLTQNPIQKAPEKVPGLAGVAPTRLGGGGYNSAVFVERGPAVALAVAPAIETAKPGTAVRFAVRIIDAFGTDLGPAPAGTTLTAPGATVHGLTVSAAAAGTYTVIARAGHRTGRALLHVSKGAKR